VGWNGERKKNSLTCRADAGWTIGLVAAVAAVGSTVAKAARVDARAIARASPFVIGVTSFHILLLMLLIIIRYFSIIIVIDVRLLLTSG